MLKRQQATAIIAARQKIVEGAVQMGETLFKWFDDIDDALFEVQTTGRNYLTSCR